MEPMKTFKPLQLLSLPGLGDLKCSGLVLIVGPNSSGKSQLLQDIYQRISGEPRSLVVASNIRVEKPEFQPFMEYLEQEGYFETIIDDAGNAQWRPLKTYAGSGQAVNQINQQQAQQWHGSHGSDPEPHAKRRSEFLNYFGRLMVTGLFLERRLTALQLVGNIDFQNQSPQHDLHALYVDDEARIHLLNEMMESFGKAIWPDNSRGNGICLKVSDGGVVPSAEDRLSAKKMANYRQLESEGDGLKSYVATCVALLLGRRPVCLIDEPEMCLHPPQAYNLGRFIGRHGRSVDAVTFVSTHSSQILRGVVQTTKDIQIVRMTRKAGEFQAHLVPADVLTEALAKPTVRAESVLDGIFAQSVVVVESDGDRLVYQTVWDTLASELRSDIHVATVGGIGGIADTCKLYQTLGIPVAVMADLDMITNPRLLRRVLEAIAEKDEIEQLCNEAVSVMEKIKNLAPQVDIDEIRNHLSDLVASDADWVVDADIRARRELNNMAKLLDRVGRLKRGGIKAFPPEVRDPLQDLVDQLSRYGIFLVPVGELEGWLVDAGIAESKENKWAWANAAANYVQLQGAQAGDIWDFVRSAGNFLRRQ